MAAHFSVVCGLPLSVLLLKGLQKAWRTNDATCFSAGDWAAKTAPDRGRIMAAQFSVACGLPLSVLLLKGLPTEDAHGFTDSLAPRYAAVMALFGLLISWCGSANSAIFAEIVPDNLRSVIYAFDRSFEGAVAACGMPLVGQSSAIACHTVSCHWIQAAGREISCLHPSSCPSAARPNGGCAWLNMGALARRDSCIEGRVNQMLGCNSRHPDLHVQAQAPEDIGFRRHHSRAGFNSEGHLAFARPRPPPQQIRRYRSLG